MPTLYEIFTGRWGAEKDAEHAKAMAAKDERITELELELLPFQAYIAATDPEAPKAGNGNHNTPAGR